MWYEVVWRVEWIKEVEEIFNGREKAMGLVPGGRGTVEGMEGPVHRTGHDSLLWVGVMLCLL